jgi:hypothetical protein
VVVLVGAGARGFMAGGQQGCCRHVTRVAYNPRHSHRNPRPFGFFLQRGVGVAFGPDVAKRWLEGQGLQMVVRSHEVKDEGFEVAHGGYTVTIFSAPNYCDQMVSWQGAQSAQPGRQADGRHAAVQSCACSLLALPALCCLIPRLYLLSPSACPVGPPARLPACRATRAPSFASTPSVPPHSQSLTPRPTPTRSRWRMQLVHGPPCSKQAADSAHCGQPFGGLTGRVWLMSRGHLVLLAPGRARQGSARDLLPRACLPYRQRPR